MASMSQEAAASVKLTIDEEQQTVKAWSDGGLAMQPNIKCSSSTTGGQVLEKLQALADEQCQSMLKREIQKKPGKFVKMEVVGLKFEGEPLEMSGTLASYGIKEGTTTISADTIYTHGEACCACDCCIPDGAWTIPCSGSNNIYKKGANSSEVNPGGAPANQEMAR